jgi:very-short-patch-repair endonuclease
MSLKHAPSSTVVMTSTRSDQRCQWTPSPQRSFHAVQEAYRCLQLARSDRIQTTANSPWGVRVLKQYLIYARTGILQQPDHGSDQPTNDFEQSVGGVLKDKGYEVVPQVGVAGFFIDLGLKHPVKPGTFLLGIECDGAGYHSARSARDRDRLRQEILENLGWKIYRIWSTDWFKSRDSEIKRMLRRIEELLGNDRPPAPTVSTLIHE